MNVSWDVEFTDEFEEWWIRLSEEEQESVRASVGLLIAKGPSLGYPHSSGISTSKYAHVRELRIQHQGRPYRVLYAFDPRRVALLLIGGDKTGDGRWYEVFVPIADHIYSDHLVALEKEEKQHGKKIQ